MEDDSLMVMQKSFESLGFWSSDQRSGLFQGLFERFSRKLSNVFRLNRMENLAATAVEQFAALFL